MKTKSDPDWEAMLRTTPRVRVLPAKMLEIAYGERSFALIFNLQGTPCSRLKNRESWWERNPFLNSASFTSIERFLLSRQDS